jgi:hypothetical protein
MNLTEAPFVPAILHGVGLITFFVAEEGGWAEAGGVDWVVRCYPSLVGMVPLMPPLGAPKVRRGFECKWIETEDFPSPDDPEHPGPEKVEDFEGEFENVTRSKIGGWPSSIQSEAWWELRKHEADPKYCLQIASEEKVGLQWGDGGTLLIGRGTAPGFENQWFLDWQSY